MFKLAGLSARLSGVSLFTMLALGVPSLLLAADNTRDELKSCAAIEKSAARLACYDSVSERYGEAPEALRTEPAASAAVSAPPDNFGAETLHRDDEKKAKDPPVAARVIRCSKDARDKYIFYIEGGQVWKQVNYKRLNFKECDFNVSIRKDFFGYKMQLEDSKKKFRVSRIR